MLWGHRVCLCDAMDTCVAACSPGSQRFLGRAACFAACLLTLPVTPAGPVTILNWSFPRKDLSRQAQAFQLAQALREEVADLEAAGCRVIQVCCLFLLHVLQVRKVCVFGSGQSAGLHLCGMQQGATGSGSCVGCLQRCAVACQGRCRGTQD